MGPTGDYHRPQLHRTTVVRRVRAQPIGTYAGGLATSGGGASSSSSSTANGVASGQPVEVTLLHPRPFVAARAILEAAPPRRRAKKADSIIAKLEAAAADQDDSPTASERRRRQKKQFAIQGAQLEHLVCCYNNDRFQGDLKAVEDQCEEQARDLQDLHHTRSEEVVMLSDEAAWLRRVLGVKEEDVLSYGGAQMDLASGGLQSTNGRTAVTLQAYPSETRKAAHDDAELVALRQQVKQRRAELDAVRRRVREAQKDAVMHRARLSVTRELREMEVHELRELLTSRTEEQRHDTEEGLLRCLTFEQLTAKEVCKLSELERTEHHKQVTDLFVQLQRARGIQEVEAPEHKPVSEAEVADALEALRTPVESLLGILEDEAAQADWRESSSKSASQNWLQDAVLRLNACCDRLERDKRRRSYGVAG